MLQGARPSLSDMTERPRFPECRKEERQGGAITESSKKDRAQIGGALTY
jgi:hypothetical protein